MLLSRNRAFTREPSRAGQAKSFYIFCEGVKRERQYFQYFREMDSRVNVEIYPLTAEEDNSPSGLLQIAKSCMLGAENQAPKYEYQKNDEIWLVFDTDPDKLDSRQPQIAAIQEFCKQVGEQQWFAAESNPCFEVWLYYHKQAQLIDFKNQDQCKAWKAQLSQLMGGL
ncbi:MAG: RloB family protein [Aureispira sp.]